jgi:hypothetical protein
MTAEKGMPESVLVSTFNKNIPQETALFSVHCYSIEYSKYKCDCHSRTFQVIKVRLV